MLQRVFPFACLLLLQSCAIAVFEKVPTRKNDTSRPVALFMDGTNNKFNKAPELNTHVASLFTLTRQNVAAYYVEGVGTRKKIFGGLFGWGTAARVELAYHFLSTHYRPGDSIYAFGFSRGANQCRILSNLVYTAGILDLDNIPFNRQQRIIKKIYRKYRGKGDALARRERVAAFVENWNDKHRDQYLRLRAPVTETIALMGLFETVEAFHVLDNKEDTRPRADHLNQVMNTNKILQAFALDDNRARTYTPVLATSMYVTAPPGLDTGNLVEEVWFNGSHRDVGGGHRKDPYLQNISLQWMLSRVEKHQIFRDTTLIQYWCEPAHNMNGTIFLKAIFDQVNRSVDRYWQIMRSDYNHKKLKVHQSVIDRLKVGIVPHFKREGTREDWYELEPFKSCFDSIGLARVLKADCNCIEVVK